MASAASVNRRPRGGEMSASARRRRRWREADDRGRGEGNGQAVLPTKSCLARGRVQQPEEKRLLKANSLDAPGQCGACEGR